MNIFKKIFLAACLAVPAHSLYSLTTGDWILYPTITSTALTLLLVNAYGEGATFKEKLTSAFKNHRQECLAYLIQANCAVLLIMYHINAVQKARSDIQKATASKEYAQAEAIRTKYETLIAQQIQLNQTQAAQTNRLHSQLQENINELHDERVRLINDYEILKADLEDAYTASQEMLADLRKENQTMFEQLEAIVQQSVRISGGALAMQPSTSLGEQLLDGALNPVRSMMSAFRPGQPQEIHT